MKYLWIFFSIWMLVIPTAKAQALEDKTSIYFKKYGQAGLDQINYFNKAAENRETPFAKSKGNYKTVYKKPKDADFSKLIPLDMPVPVNPECISGDEVSLESQTINEYYAVKQQGKQYLLRVEKIFCLGDLYNAKKKALRPEYDGDRYSVLHFYRDGKKIFDVKNAGKYSIYKSDLVMNVSGGCCNMESWFNHYDWVSGKTIATNALEISLDDAPSADVDLTEIVLPNGQLLCDFAKKLNDADTIKSCEEAKMKKAE